MTTTFSVAFKNRTLDTLTGRASTQYSLGYLSGYAGSILADPTTSASLLTSYSNGGNLSGFMSQSAGGVSAMSVARSTSTSTTGMVLGCARVFDAIGTAVIDTTASLAGGGGGVIVPTLTVSTGVAFQFNQFSLKLPNNLGTVFLNDPLRDALVNAHAVSAVNIAALSSATINVYSGMPPASANAAATGTLLWTASTQAGGATWNSASGGAAGLAATLAAAAVGGSATTATYLRITKGAYCLQGTVGTSGADFIFDSVTMTSGTTYTLLDATLVI